MTRTRAASSRWPMPRSAPRRRRRSTAGSPSRTVSSSSGRPRRGPCRRRKSSSWFCWTPSKLAPRRDTTAGERRGPGAGCASRATPTRPGAGSAASPRAHCVPRPHPTPPGMPRLARLERTDGMSGSSVDIHASAWKCAHACYGTLHGSSSSHGVRTPQHILYREFKLQVDVTSSVGVDLGPRPFALMGPHVTLFITSSL
mmetsp:Transcript_93033/g.300647  ORF Transcript_93033/g.300647 Transcript_93033/m.300647 type:complete len:200 (+) Transcript_93033:73-672(+)